MLCLLITLLALQSQSSVVNTFPGADETRLWSQGLADGRNFDYTVKTAALSKVPKWTPEKQNPPLSFPRAVEIAQHAVKADHPEFHELMVWSFRLQHVGALEFQNRWFYVVEMYPMVGGKLSYQTEISVVVLMDGTVVKPTEKARTVR